MNEKKEDMNQEKESLIKKISELEETVASLREEKNDMEILFETVNEHSTSLENELQNIVTKMKRYLSPQHYDSIVEGLKTDDLTYERKFLSIFFSDIVNFSTITDGIEPEVLSDCLNLYLDEMSNIAISHGGTIDKFIGDAVMVFFGDPATKGERDDALACVKMAIEMQEKIGVIRQYWKENGIPINLQVRMGINSGYCTVGNFGSKKRMDYTIIGGQVNIASRLETAAAPESILISESTYDLVCKAIETEEKPAITVKGIHYPITTFEVKGIIDDSSISNRVYESIGDGFIMEQIVFNPKTTGQEAQKELEEALTKALNKIRGCKSEGFNPFS